MQTYFDLVDKSVVAMWAKDYNPDQNAEAAREFGSCERGIAAMPVTATTAALASIRARGNWMLVNGQWHRK